MEMPSRANSMASNQTKTPSLFPCANRVKMPQFGSDETNIKPKRMFKAERTFLRSSSLPPDAKNNFVKRISTGLSFSEDVVKERCFHLLPYSEKYFHEALDYTNLIPRPPKAIVAPGRHNMRGADKRHLPCHIKKRTHHQLKPMKRQILERAAEMNPKTDPSDKENKHNGQDSKDSFFMTETEHIPSVTPTGSPPPPAWAADRPMTKPKGIDKKEWDAYLMSLLSQSTAQWIVKGRMSPGEQQHELEELLTVRYGPLDKDDEVELIKDNISEADFDAKVEETKKKWRKGEETYV